MRQKFRRRMSAYTVAVIEALHETSLVSWNPVGGRTYYYGVYLPPCRDGANLFRESSH